MEGCRDGETVGPPEGRRDGGRRDRGMEGRRDGGMEGQRDNRTKTDGEDPPPRKPPRVHVI
jgi:hypothetical protein